MTLKEHVRVLFDMSVARYVITCLPYVSSTPDAFVDSTRIACPELSVTFGLGHRTRTKGLSGRIFIVLGQLMFGFSLSVRKKVYTNIK